MTSIYDHELADTIGADQRLRRYQPRTETNLRTRIDTLTTERDRLRSTLSRLPLRHCILCGGPAVDRLCAGHADLAQALEDTKE